MRRALLPGLLLLPLAAGGGAAQAPVFSTGVRPDTVTVGDRFTTVLRVDLPPGATVELPARLDSTPDLHAVGERVDQATGAGAVAAAWPMVAWRPGAPGPLSATVRVAYPDGRVATERVALRLPWVRSVLPADSSRVEPRGPKDVIGPDWDRRLLALLIALVLLLLAPSAWLVRRLVRRRRARAPGPPGDPRARALAALELARRARHAERGEWKAFYTLTSEALRGFLEALSPRWSADLTTEELVHALRAEPGARPDAAALLAALLAEADAAKFARAASTPEAAERHWRQARDWVAGFDAAPADAPESGAREPVEAAR